MPVKTQPIILIHYGELGLKGQNRPDFIKQLAENIRLKLAGHDLNWPVNIHHGYLTIPLLGGRPKAESQTQTQKYSANLLKAIKQVFGIAWYARAEELSITNSVAGLDDLENKVIALASKIFQPGKTFAVRVNRADKSFPLNSHELEVRLGKAIQDKTQWQEVDLDQPSQTFYLDIHRQILQLYTEKIKGFDGLPVSTSGLVLSLLSGGIDSPVAAWLLAKRGATVDCLHFAATHMQLAQAKTYLISQITAKLSEYTLKTRLFIVPYTHFNLALLVNKSDYELVLFRRFMMRVAERLSKQIKAQVIITGDNLAQVASQTLDNLISSTQAIDTPVLRPLITYNKQETIKLAKKIGTYQLSIQPYKDCCSLIDRHPKTISDHAKLTELEQKLLPDYEELINNTLNDIVVLEFKKGQLILKH